MDTIWSATKILSPRRLVLASRMNHWSEQACLTTKWFLSWKLLPRVHWPPLFCGTCPLHLWKYYPPYGSWDEGSTVSILHKSFLKNFWPINWITDYWSQLNSKPIQIQPVQPPHPSVFKRPNDHNIALVCCICHTYSDGSGNCLRSIAVEEVGVNQDGSLLRKIAVAIEHGNV